MPKAGHKDDAMHMAAHDDPFRDVSRWDEDTSREWVGLLNQRASASDQIRMRSELLRVAQIEEGDTAVEIGCGTGALLVDLARAVGESGRVVGVDPQPHFVEAARERLLREGI
jgi:ubiquinone/menaquinone biosynthesis C-methylase UbiE